jgi:predicted DNA-binding helix-hairpin-helix protein
MQRVVQLARIEHLCYSGFMDSFEKLALVATASEFEAEGEPHSPLISPTRSLESASCQFSLSPQPSLDSNSNRFILAKGHQIPIHRTYAPGGKRIPLLKAMLTTVCEFNCHYCAFTKDRNYRRVTFRPQELAEVFFSIAQKGLVEGIFLSTGVFDGGANTQNKLLDTAKILRRRLGYQGYIHLKIMPGSEKDQLLQAMQLADRVSANLEAPNATRLASLAPRKQFEDHLLRPLQWMNEIRNNLPPHMTWKGRWPSSSTQFVVGPAKETDLELISLTAKLTKISQVARTYFEAFSPVPGTPLENHPPEKPIRQHRLYQASFLLRDYGFDVEDFSFSKEGNLPLEIDPKKAYAQTFLKPSPVELNTADREKLLRIPGIGPTGATSITKARKTRRINDLSQLKKMGILAERAAPYILLDGKRPDQQLDLL